MSKGVLVVTASPGGSVLSHEHAELAERWAVNARGTRWLAAGEAFEIQCDGASRPDTGFDADFNFVSGSSPDRCKKLLVADMESTIIEQECLDELADYAGLRDRVSELTEQAMAGELDFETAIRERVGLLRGLSVDALEDVYTSRITLMPGANTLIATMAANGGHCALVSGGFTWFTARIAEQLGFHSHQANELVIENGKLTGEVRDPILGRAAKKTALERLCRELGITPDEAISVGDGANDLDMLQTAGLGVAYRAKPIVAKTAPQRIDHGDLTALLYLQGYTRSGFIPAA